MRRLHFATLLLMTVSLLASGCRQTTGPSTAGPVTSTGPLTPLSTGQSPTLGPFGGPTRVTPPSTGSFATPNNYLGGPAPAGQASAGISPIGAFVPQPSGGVIGSGVQVAGWTQPNPGIAPTQAPIGTSTYGINSSTTQNPRAGGMQVIDLTRAAAPPGYRPPAPIYNNQLPAVAPVNPNWQQSPPTQSFQNQPFQNQPFQNQGGVRAVITPGAAQIAGGRAPSPSVAPLYPINQPPVDPNYPRTAIGPTAGPSTEPINTGNSGGSQQNLPWRQPGTQY